MNSTAKDILAMLGVALVVFGVCVGGWFLYWGLKSSSVNHNAALYQQSYGAQSAYVEEAHNLIAQLYTIDVQIASPGVTQAESEALTAQKAALTTQTCGIVHNITNPPADELSFAATNC